MSEYQYYEFLAIDRPLTKEEMAVLRALSTRGHRRLAAKTYDTKCQSCIWGCRMPVEMINDEVRTILELRNAYRQ